MTKEILILLRRQWNGFENEGGGEEKERRRKRKKKENQEKLEITCVSSYIYMRVYIYTCVSLDQQEGREATRVQVSPKFFISLSSAAFS